MSQTIFLSPHSDDIAFSCGGGILKNPKLKNQSWMIATIFSKSKYTFSRALKNSPETVTSIRINEDKKYCMSIGASYHNLELSEGNLRGYPDLDSLYKKKNGRNDPDYEDIKKTVVDFVSEHPGALIFSPIGIGNHIEHLITQEIAIFLERQGRRILFYEDLPYAAGFPLAELNQIVSTKLGKRTPRYIDVSDVIEDKINSLAIYESQISESQLNDVSKQSQSYFPQSPFRFERIWL